MDTAELERVNNSRSLERSEQLEQALGGIYEISRILTCPTRLEAALSGVIASLMTYFDMRHTLIVLFRDDNAPQVIAGPEWDEDVALGFFEHVAEPVVREVAATKLPVVSKTSAASTSDAWEIGANEGGCAFIGVPIFDRDQVIGAITTEHCDVIGHSEQFQMDVNFLTMVANLVGQTVRLQNLVTRDRERLMEEGRRAVKEREAANPNANELGVAGIIGESAALRSVLKKIHIIARSHLPVLLRGESGTGKELFAQAIHDLSPRHDGPLIKLNCAALPETMLESELFGHEKGAFTGALMQRKGRFELADGGTLFLDEIGEISASFQAKLLRVLQEGEFERVGGATTVKVNVRLVTATNRNLEEEVSKGNFRADLYFRIGVVPILLAPLRERREDIPLLACEFLRRFNEANGTMLTFSDDAMGLICACEFPGNIRELESCVRRTAAFAHGSRIVADDFACRNDSCLSSLLWKGRAERSGPVHCSPIVPISIPARAIPSNPAGNLGVRHPNSATNHESTMLEEDSTNSSEHDRLIEAMNKAGWVQAKAARLLGLTPRQMGYALRKHQIEIKRF